MGGRRRPLRTANSSCPATRMMPILILEMFRQAQHDRPCLVPATSARTVAAGFAQEGTEKTEGYPQALFSPFAPVLFRFGGFGFGSIRRAVRLRRATPRQERTERTKATKRTKKGEKMRKKIRVNPTESKQNAFFWKKGVDFGNCGNSIRLRGASAGRVRLCGASAGQGFGGWETLRQSMGRTN
jgi:hypothetical protein